MAEVRLDVDQFKKIQIGILDYVACFCDANGIKYWLDSGTLIGAVRHKGYIPWDDDIDIGMLREDYDRFLELFPKKDNKYIVKSIELDKEFLYPFAKIMDTGTVLYEPDRKGNKLCVNIDLFIYDNAPSNPRDIDKMYKHRDDYRVLHVLRNNPYQPSGNIVRRFFVYIARVCIRVFPKDYFIKKMVLNSRKYESCSDLMEVGNFMGYAKYICQKEVFSSFIDAEFEGHTYKIPAGYDKWLKSIYGNYMELPPVEKRVSHHDFEAYIV